MSKRRDFDVTTWKPREIPTYGTFDAARYLRMPENTIRAWAFGRSYPAVGGQRRTSPIIEVADPSRHLLSFVNLVELHVLDAIRREHEVPMPEIRKAVRYLRREFESKHPLADEAMETDGSSLFVRKLNQLINVSNEGQLAMEAMLEAHLRRIDRDPKGLAIRLFLLTRKRSRIAGAEHARVDEPRAIAIDPTVAFGRPVIAGSRVPTIEIAERFKAGESSQTLARDYERPQEEIEEAIRCELDAA